jgi:hypothetical protein
MMITNPELWGCIPNMLSPWDDVTPLWEQVHNEYCQYGGWNDFEGFEVLVEKGGYVLKYPGDPALREIGRIAMNDQLLVLFPYSWVMYLSADRKECRIARID